MTSEVEARRGISVRYLTKWPVFFKRITSESNGIHELIILDRLNRRT